MLRAVMARASARLRLIKWRWRRHRRRAAAIALCFAFAVFCLELAGYRKFVVWNDPRPLSEVWWHFPVWTAVFFAVLLLWPWRDEWPR